jgi:hypothetical protein
VLDGERGDVWCDPFHGGAVLDADGCRRRFEMVYGGALAFQRAFLSPTPPAAIVARMLANLERSELATDPVQRAWMCELHLAVPGTSFQEQLELADQLARTGDVVRAAVVFDGLADRAESNHPASDAGDNTAAKLRTRARGLRARLN